MSITSKLKKFIDDSRHVISISYKPTREEYNRSARLIIFGILLIGTIGFIIAIIISLIITGSLSLI
ncbi:MAG: protein translocase SEC61 complex subunit gamma [Candidatus Micrarchaeaceae archaeon]|jgi:protein transport protein SEC61 subunit gamma and related proteins